jgi:uncharacterized membrane protein YhhN
MNKKILILLYFLVLAIDLFAVYSDNENLRYISKPLLMPFLLFLFISVTKSFPSVFKKWIVLALLFSWGGDVLLMFEPVGTQFFIFGLVSFLLAHIFYILFYESITRAEGIQKNYLWLIPVAAYCTLLVIFLWKNLGEMKIPVSVYSVVIGFMLVQAIQTIRIKNKGAAWQILTGALFFVVSDSLLATNKFSYSFEYAGIAVMGSYGLAQLLITLGAIRYFSKE